MWPEQCPADAHDARVLARQIAPITGAVCSASVWSRGLCGQNNAQLMLMMFASWLAKWRQSLGSLFCKRLELRGLCGQNNAQLMLMMLASWLAKWRQSLGQFVLQASGA